MRAAPLSNEAPSGARRIVWVDVARVMAAFFIIASHLNLYNATLYRVLWSQFLFARTPFFLITAAYFVGRGAFGNLQGRPRLLVGRAGFLLIPYLIWSLVATALIGNSVFHPHYQEYQPFYMWLSGQGASWGDGLAALGKCFGIGGHPADAPMWFLRDIIILTLFAPLLARFKSYLLPIGIVLLSLDLFGTSRISRDWLMPDSLGFFCLGLYLSRFSLTQMTDAIRPHAWFYSLMLVPLTVWLVCNRDHFSALMALVGVLCLSSLALVITEKAPRLSSKIARLAPAGFLVFGVHYILIILLLNSGFITLEGWAWDLVWLLLVPVIYAVIYGLFYLIRAYFPGLLPALAAYRIKAK